MKNLYTILILATVLITSCTKNETATPLSRDIGNGKAGSTAKMITVDNHLYAINDKELKVFNLDNPQSPSLVNTVNVGFGIETIFPFAHYLFIGSTNGLYVYDISNPTTPTLTTQEQVQHITACDPVVANSNYAYVTLNSNRLNCGSIDNVNLLITYDISDINNIVEMSNIDVEIPKGLALEGDRLYVCSGNNGIVIFDLSETPETPIQTGNIGGFTANDIILDNGVMMVVCEDGLRQFDYTNPDNITLMSLMDL